MRSIEETQCCECREGALGQGVIAKAFRRTALRRLVLLFLMAIAAGLAFVGQAPAEQRERCSAAELRKLVFANHPTGGDRIREIIRQLRCLGTDAPPRIAAAASYEVAMDRAGADGRPPDYAEGARWAKRSAELADKAGDHDLAAQARLAGAQLDYYAAADLDELRAAERSVRQAGADCATVTQPVHCAALLKLLGEVQRDITSHAPEMSAQAIETFRQFLTTKLGKVRGPERASALLDLGTLIAQAAPDDMSAKDLAEASDSLAEAASFFKSAGDVERAQIADINRGALLVDHGPNTAASLDLAEALLRPMATDPNIDPAFRLKARSNLGGLLARKQTGNREENIAEAIDLLEGVYDATPADGVEERARTIYNLANALSASGIDRAERLSKAEQLLESTIDATPSEGMEVRNTKLLWMLADVKLALLQGGDFEVFDPAERSRLLDEIKAIIGKADAIDRGQRSAEGQATVSDYLLAMTVDRDAAFRDEAISSMRQAAALVDRVSRPYLWATIQNNLGNLCNDARRPDLGGCAEQAYARALSVRTEREFPREHADTIVNLAALRFRQANWTEAAALYGEIARLSVKDFDISLGQAVARHDAARSDRWFERGSYSLARLGRTDEAVLLADQGRVRFLQQRLGAVAAATGDLAGHLAKVIDSDSVRLIIPVTTSAGTVVFFIGRQENRIRIGQLFLDNLSGDKVAGFVNGVWLQNYESSWERPGVLDRNAAFAPALAQTSEWLGTELVVPTLKAMDEQGIPARGKLVFVLQGELAQLPVHLARLANGKRLLEEEIVSYLPGLSLSVSAPQAGSPARIVSIADPSAAPDLNFAPLEGRIAAGEGGTTLTGPVTREGMMDVLAHADILHFVGHARFDAQDPEASSLRLTGEDRLTVGQIERAALDRLPRLVVLSACETGRSETATMANEFVGLPTAFIGLGVRGVVSSLWPASDGPTVLLMAHLMRDLSHGQDPALALREAQIWLSDATGRELAETLRALKPDKDTPAAKLEFVLRLRYADRRPFAAPWAWAGFQYTGVTMK
ncbi:hypothetical protein CPT34_28705 [Rhizobium sophoriradicis]|uniref:CHAT domain-containing protein n=1 Tax=Rhizobium sophoriradicis TaxID=1535245 RepID=A0A2A5KKX0_9HYPH|nr:hypothetical protein CPT34_28705 [Rhizobium sophoriradicis]